MSCIPIQDFSLISLCDATKAGKLYSIVPDDGSGDFTFARNSTAPYTNSAGSVVTAAIDEPRIDFSVSGEYKGLLMQKEDAGAGRDADVCTLTSASALIGQTEGVVLFRPLFDTPTEIHVLGQNLTVTNQQVKIEYSATEIKYYLNDTLVATKTGTFDFSGTDKIQLGHYENGSQLGAHIQNFALI